MSRLFAPSFRRSLPLALAVLVLAGCTGRGVANVPHPALKPPTPTATTPRTAPGPMLLPLPRVTAHELVAISSLASLTGTVSLQWIGDTYFSSSAATYDLQSVAAGSALLNVKTLEEALYTAGGNVITGATRNDGAFTLTNQVPSDRPYVLEARLAGDHRLSAIVAQGQSTATLDEASSMVTEMARWQLFAAADANNPDITDLTAADLSYLHDRTTAVVNAADLPEITGSAPSIEALKTGAGHLLRNIYVAEFGAKVTAPNTPSTPAEANQLSDKWEAILGFKPLALTAAAGSGVHTYDLEEGKVATDSGLVTPTDCVEDASGNLYIAERENYAIRIVPRQNILGPFLESPGDAGTNTLTAGHIYSIAGLENTSRNATDYNTYFTGAVDGTGGVPINSTSGVQLFTPTRLLLRTGTINTAKTNILFSSSLDCRLFMIAMENATHFGIPMQANHLYAIAGTGNNYGVVNNGVSGDDGLATAANLGEPTALTADSAGNLFMLDTGPNGKGEIRVVRENDGKIYTLPVTMNGNPLDLSNCGDLKLSPDGQWLYVADTRDHFVFKVLAPSPTNISLFPGGAGALGAIRVLGNPGQQGFINTTAGLLYPDVHQVSAPLAESVTNNGVTTIQALLNAPTALAFTPGGDLLVADANRVRLLRSGQVYTIAGGFATNFVTGDSRLCTFQNTSAMNWSSFEKNVLLTDSGMNRVRRLWTVRGVLTTGN